MSISGDVESQPGACWLARVAEMCRPWSATLAPLWKLIGRALTCGTLINPVSGLWMYVLSVCRRMARLVGPVTGLEVLACVFWVVAIPGKK